MPLDTLNLSGTEANVFGNLRSMFDSSQTFYQGILHHTNPIATGAIPVLVSTGRPVARSEERLGSTTPMPETARRPSTRNSPFPAEGEFFGCTAKTADIGASVRQVSHTFIAFMLEDKIQNPSKCLFRFTPGANVMDQRSGDGRFSGRFFKIISIN